MSSNTQKLRVIRSRTDHDLLILVQRELDRGFALVDVATSRNSPLFAKAHKAHHTATAMFPRIFGLSQDDWLHVEARLKELRSRLDHVPAYANVRSYPASFAS
jgi:hypothetical protein